jgi:hypothetical protein
MPLVRICDTADISEALVIRATLEAHGVRATLCGFEHCYQNWLAMPALNHIPVLVSDLDAELAMDLIDEARLAEPASTWVTNSFWQRSLWHGFVSVYLWFKFGVFLMPWYRSWRGLEAELAAPHSNHLPNP